MFTSCNVQQKQERDIKYLSLSSAEKIKSLSYKEQTVIGIPSQLELIEEHLFLFRSYGCVAQILTSKEGIQVGCFGQMGQGPGEHISPYFSGYDATNKEMYIWDVSLNRMSCYHPELPDNPVSFVENNQMKKDQHNLTINFDIHYIGNEKFVGVVSSGTDLTNYFLLLDKEQKIIQRFGNVPFLSGLAGLNLTRLMGQMTSLGSRFVFAAMNYGYIVCYDISTDNEIEKIWEYYLSKPIYENRNGEILFKEENKLGFFDVKMNSKHIFALYRGYDRSRMDEKLLAKHLLVFDLEGNLLRSFELDKKSVRIAVTEENKIYALAVETDSEIVQYDLSELI